MRRMDECEYPFYGSRQMTCDLRREGVIVGRHPAATGDLPAGAASVANSEHRRLSLPAAPRDLAGGPCVVRGHHLCVTQGFFYLVAVDGARHVLAWRLNTRRSAWTRWTTRWAGGRWAVDQRRRSPSAGCGRGVRHLERTTLKYEAPCEEHLRRKIGSTSTTRCDPIRPLAGGRRARPTATARGRRERRILAPAGARPGRKRQAPLPGRVPLPGPMLDFSEKVVPP